MIKRGFTTGEFLLREDSCKIAFTLAEVLL